MEAVLQEYLFYFSSVFAGLSSLAFAYVIFLEYLRDPNKKGHFWRVFGFSFLALAFLLFEWARINAQVQNIAIIIETIGYFLIVIGMYFTRELIPTDKEGNDTPTKIDLKKIDPKVWRTSIVLVFLFIVLLLLLTQIAWGILIVYGLALISCLAIMIMQILRYKSSTTNKASNLLAFIAFIFIFFRIVIQIILNIPRDLTLAFLKIQTADFSPLFYVMLIFTFLGFLFLLLLNWKFLVAGFSQKLFVTLIVLTILITNISSLFVSAFIIDQIRNNNIELVKKGVRIQNLLITERGRKAQFYAHSFSNDESLIHLINKGITADIEGYLLEKISESGLDEIKIYNKYSELIASPVDKREFGKIFSNDKYLSYTISGGKGILTIDRIPGVLAEDVILRAIYPITQGNSIIGAVETIFKFDNAFADYIKKQTDLDVTIFSDTVRSATTITTGDEVSRWLGTIVTDENIIQYVLKNGMQYETEELIFDSYYFTSYMPLKDVNGEITGMLSAQSSIDKVMESTRYQSIINFIVITNVSLIGTLVVYIAIRKIWIKNINEKYLK